MCHGSLHLDGGRAQHGLADRRGVVARSGSVLLGDKHKADGSVEFARTLDIGTAKYDQGDSGDPHGSRCNHSASSSTCADWLLRRCRAHPRERRDVDQVESVGTLRFEMVEERRRRRTAASDESTRSPCPRQAGRALRGSRARRRTPEAPRAPRPRASPSIGSRDFDVVRAARCAGGSTRRDSRRPPSARASAGHRFDPNDLQAELPKERPAFGQAVDAETVLGRIHRTELEVPEFIGVGVYAPYGSIATNGNRVARIRRSYGGARRLTPLRESLRARRLLCESGETRCTRISRCAG